MGVTVTTGAVGELTVMATEATRSSETKIASLALAFPEASYAETATVFVPGETVVKMGDETYVAVTPSPAHDEKLSDSVEDPQSSERLAFTATISEQPLWSSTWTERMALSIPLLISEDFENDAERKCGTTLIATERKMVTGEIPETE